jgi:hypothetical protein
VMPTRRLERYCSKSVTSLQVTHTRRPTVLSNSACLSPRSISALSALSKEWVGRHARPPRREGADLPWKEARREGSGGGPEEAGREDTAIPRCVACMRLCRCRVLASVLVYVSVAVSVHVSVPVPAPAPVPTSVSVSLSLCMYVGVCLSVVCEAAAWFLKSNTV